METTSNNVVTAGNHAPAKTESEKKTCLDSCSDFCEKASDSIISVLESGFYTLGKTVARRPWIFIIVSILVVGLCSLGFIRFYEEVEPSKLWIPANSQAGDNKKTIEAVFLTFSSISQVIFVKKNGGNILTSDALTAIFDFDQTVKQLTIQNEQGNQKYSDLCTMTGFGCLQVSLFSTLSYTLRSNITERTDEEILSDVNDGTYIFNDISEMLGEISYDENNRIISAKAFALRYFLRTSNAFETENDAARWEQEFLDYCASTLTSELARAGIYIYYSSFRSFSDEIGSSIRGDLPLLTSGYFLCFLFLVSVLGKFNCREQKIYVAFVGILCVGLAIISAIGIASLIDFVYGPMHSIFPFLILGIGADDIFVLVTTLDNVVTANPGLPVIEQMGLMMKHAGVSILITSITNVLVFAVGASTIIPALRSFCVYCSLGILCVFLLTLILFTAILTYDQRRISANRNAILCCYVHSEDYQPCALSQKSLVKRVLHSYFSPLILTLPAKIIILLLTAGLLGTSIYGVTQLELQFKEEWWIPERSYLSSYSIKSKVYFPEDGLATVGYLMGSNIDYLNDRDVFLQLRQDLDKLEHTTCMNTNFWLYHFTQYLNGTYGNINSNISLSLNANNWFDSNSEFIAALKVYLNEAGEFYKNDIIFIGDSENEIAGSRFKCDHGRITDIITQITAMDNCRQLMSDTLDYTTNEVFLYSPIYLVLERDKIIQNELKKNLLLAFIIILIICFVLIANLFVCIFVGSCVIFTLVAVGGTMYYSGLTINTVTAIVLIIAVGLAVDYAAHIGHTFMAVVGSRKQRARKTLSEIGPAVCYGGFSTFLAFSLLFFADSYLFNVFFKIFSFIVLFGLFHGIVFLPVLLSLIGPKPYGSAASAPQVEAAPEEKYKVPSTNGATDVHVRQQQPGRENASFHFHPENVRENSKETNISPEIKQQSEVMNGLETNISKGDLSKEYDFQSTRF